MKTMFFAILGILLPFISSASAQKEVLTQDFLLDANALNEVGPTDDSIQAAENLARDLLKQKPRTLRKRVFPGLRQKAVKADETSTVMSYSRVAPFGLIWGSSVEETQKQGILLSPILEKDYPNSFSTSKLPKALDDFSRVDVSYGSDDKLWRIIAYGSFLDDDASASKVMRLYKIYSSLLNKKYGNKEEFFTPAQIEEISKNAQGKEISTLKDAPLGNKNFLSQLQNGSAVLYSTFHNKEVGAAIAVNVDGDGKSYIVIDYKNLMILNAQEKETLDAL